MKPGPNSRREFIGKAATGLAVAVAQPGEVLAGPGKRQGKIRLAIVGAGDRGLELAREASECAGVELAGFADIYRRRLEGAAAVAPQAKLVADFRELVDDRSIDALVIATPPHVHTGQFEAALAAGKHVYIENVMALDTPNALRMRQAVAAAPKAVVQVGHQSCSWAMMRDARELTAESHMGQITAIRARFDRNTPHGRPLWARPVYPDINPNTVDWQAFSGSSEPREFDPVRFVNWRYFWDYSQGQVSEALSHQLAFWMQALNLGVPQSATMTGGLYRWQDGREVPDTMTVVFNFGHLLFTWDSGAGNGYFGAEEAVLGTDATVVKNQHIAWIPQKVMRVKDAAITRRPVNAPRAHMENFLAAIRTGSPVNCPFETGFATSIACRMAVESLWTGRTMHWDAASEQIL